MRFVVRGASAEWGRPVKKRWQKRRDEGTAPGGDAVAHEAERPRKVCVCVCAS